MRTRNHLHQSFLLYLTICLSVAGISLAACAAQGATPTQLSEPQPTATQQSLPDLTVSSIWVEPPENRPCNEPAAGMKLHIIIQNRGEASAGEFVVSALASQQDVAAGLAAGGEIDVEFTGYTADLLVQVDPSGQVQESDETNNQYSAQLSLPTLPAECYPTPTPEVQTQESSITFTGHTGKVLDIDFSPDGNLIASGSVDNTLRLWRVDQGALLRTMLGHPFPVTAVEFSPNGATLATGSTDGMIRLWSVSNGLLSRTLQAHGGEVLDIDFSPDGSRLASSATDFTVRLWDTTNGRLLQTIDEGLAQVNSLTYSQDGRLLAWSEQDGSIKVWRISDGAWILNLHSIYQPATQIAFPPDQKWLVSGYSDGRIQFWSFPEGELIDTLERHSGAVTGLAFSPDGGFLASGSEDGSILLWEVLDNPVPVEAGTLAPGLQITLKEIYLGHTGQVNKVYFSPRGDLIASCGDDGTVRLWSVPEK